MKIQSFLIAFIVLIGFIELLSKDNTTIQNESSEFKMTLLLEADNPIIKEYEIEFWQEIESKNTKELPIQKILKPGRNILSAPPNSNFFRVRAVALLNIRGYWTNFNPIKRYPLEKEQIPAAKLEVPKPIPLTEIFLKISTHTGKEDLYLASQKIQIRNLVSKNVTTYYRINGGNWQTLPKESPIYFNEDGDYELEYYGIDPLGNKEQTKQLTFKNDKKAPETYLEVLGEISVNNHHLYISGNSRLQLVAHDNLSGIDRIFYRLGCQFPLQTEWTVYQNQISILSLLNQKCDGILLIEYYSRDKVGNTESANRKEIHFPKLNE